MASFSDTGTEGQSCELRGSSVLLNRGFSTSPWESQEAENLQLQGVRLTLRKVNDNLVSRGRRVTLGELDEVEL